MNEVQQEHNLKLASAQTQEEILLLLEKTRKLIYDRTEDLIKDSANEAATKTVTPNCVRCVARAIFSNPLKKYTGIIDENREQLSSGLNLTNIDHA